MRGAKMRPILLQKNDPGLRQGPDMYFLPL